MPRAVHAHELRAARHRGTSRKLFGDRYIDQVIRRNQHLFTWRNVTDPRMIAAHFLLLPNVLLQGARRRDLRFEIEALLKALVRFPKALYLREKDRPAYRLRDREVLALSSSYVHYDAHYGRPSWPVALASRQSLRILFPLARLPKCNTDGSWILFNLIKRLSARHRITLLSFIDRSDEEPSAEALRPYCEKVDVLLRRQNYGAPNPHGLVPRRLAIDYTDPRMYAKIDEYVHGGNFDVIQCEYLEMAHMLPDLSRFPSIFTHHEVLSLASDRAMRGAATLGEWLGPAYDRMLYLAYERKVCRRFRKVVTLSSVDGDYLKSYDRTLDVVTVPSGVNTEWFTPDPTARAHEQPHIVFVGYYLHPPNVDAATFLAREIFPIVRQTVPEARCYLVGKEPTEEVLELARLDSHVIVTGFVPDLRPVLRDAAVVAIPIRKGAGLRGKFLEGWAMAKPVVATTVAAEGFDARDGVHYLQADRAEGFAERIIELLKDKERRARLGDAGRALVTERYSDEAMARAYEKIYFELIERRA
ncbi:MAG: glycosyltransferase family 4 protein [Planctomycetota bacterium]